MLNLINLSVIARILCRDPQRADFMSPNNLISIKQMRVCRLTSTNGLLNSGHECMLGGNTTESACLRILPSK